MEMYKDIKTAVRVESMRLELEEIRLYTQAARTECTKDALEFKVTYQM